MGLDDVPPGPGRPLGAEQRTVAFYPTHIVRQLYLPPWAEYARAAPVHPRREAIASRIWSSGPAWSLSLVGVSVIARQLGAARCADSSSPRSCARPSRWGSCRRRRTQNDYVGALWLVCLVSALLALERAAGAAPGSCRRSEPRPRRLDQGHHLRVRGAVRGRLRVSRGELGSISQKLGHGLVIGLCAVALNAPHFVRNLRPVRAARSGPGQRAAIATRTTRSRRPSWPPTCFATSDFTSVRRRPPSMPRSSGAIDGAPAAMGIAPDDPRSTWPMHAIRGYRPRARTRTSLATACTSC